MRGVPKFLTRAIAALAAFALALPAPAQASGLDRGLVFRVDASQMPPQMALQCAALLEAAREKQVPGAGDKTAGAMRDAFADIVNAQAQRAGMKSDISTLMRPVFDDLIANWDVGTYLENYKVCLVMSEAGLAKFRAAPGGGVGLTCWAYKSLKAPDDADTRFLEFDLRAALTALDVYAIAEGDALELARAQVGAALAGPQAAQVDATFGQCADKTRPDLRTIAYGGADQPAWSKNVLFGEVLRDLHYGLAGPAEQFAPLFHEEHWAFDKDAYAKWMASPEFGNAIACTHLRPLRKGRPQGAMAPFDIATRMLTDSGLSTVGAVRIVGAALSQPSLYNSTPEDKLLAACNAWGGAAAQKYGAAYYEGYDAKSDELYKATDDDDGSPTIFL